MKSITLFAILTLASFYLSLQPTNAADHKAGDKEAIFNNAKAFVDAFEKGYAKPRQPFGPRMAIMWISPSRRLQGRPVVPHAVRMGQWADAGEWPA